jgi:hypothetical protein
MNNIRKHLKSTSMPRPETKEELLALSQKNYDKLIELVDSYSDEALNKKFPEGYLNRNIRDVLEHLHHWHLLFLNWYTIGMAGGKPKIPAEGYTWKTLPDLNREIQIKYAKTDLEDTLIHWRLLITMCNELSKNIWKRNFSKRKDTHGQGRPR